MNLSSEKIAYFKNRLRTMKQELIVDMKKHEGTSPNDSINELADYDNHPADMGTEQFEQERNTGFDQMRRDRLREIDDALARIENGTYGVSEKSGKPIPEERLEAEPTARYLVEEE
ncbi:hypothetical protein GCM10011409_12860 [Lentibacillus populi]|uniref:DksA C4-type domain-containing protein n=1 Tax=Lentibacillus populi TaxID=1827502 RepID=A0A9W5X569_9BACI|nr:MULTISPECIES: hypothetical protein [Bacillaceae]GGB36833.1 hypothetical protein GCM10011409_12860 [Lentibacillus populi]